MILKNEIFSANSAILATNMSQLVPITMLIYRCAIEDLIPAGI